MIAWPWLREPTIGDRVADSIDQRPDDWTVARSGPFTWLYANARRHWQLTRYADVRHSWLAFDGCALTWRERRRVERALDRWHRAHERARRDQAERRAQLQVVD